MENQELLIGIRSGSRYLACIIDNFFAIFFSLSCLYIIFLIYDFEFPVIKISLICFFYLLYYFVMESLFSRTFGKIFTKIIITNQERQNINWKQALIRTLLRIFEVNPFIGALPSILFIIISPKRQRIGDILARTVVIYKID